MCVKLSKVFLIIASQSSYKKCFSNTEFFYGLHWVGSGLLLGFSGLLVAINCWGGDAYNAENFFDM